MNIYRRKMLLLPAAALLAASITLAQESGRLPGSEARKLYRQVADLMETTSIAAPELARAGAPLIENARQSARALTVGATREHSGVLEKLVTSARIYLQIADAVPKPKPFAEDVRKQMSALRDSVDQITAHFRALLDYKESVVRDADRDNLQRYAQSNSEIGPASPTENRVVFLGDSITDGWRINQYFPGKPYVNRGIGGQITGQMLGRMKADVIDLKPSVVVVLAGTNDLARGVPSDTIKNNLTMIGALAQAAGISPVFSAILPVSDHHKRQDPNYERTPLRPPSEILSLNVWLEQKCEESGYGFVDYHAPMVGGDGQLRAELAADGLHPNGEGYKIMAPLAEKAIQQAIRSRRKPAKKKRFGIF